MQESPRSFQKFKKIPLFFALLFLSASAYSFYYLYTQINTNQVDAEVMQNEWQTEAARRNEITSLDYLIKSTEEKRAILESHFAYASDIVPFLDTIEGLAVKAGATSEVVSVDILKDKSGLMVEIKAVGSFESVYKFLRLLENSPYELEFLSTDMQNAAVKAGADGKTTSSLWSADFRIKLLSFIQ
ncbi:MAG: hypothetical protein KBC06_01900 [Candidatus Pacebacteria bacterium]|nr:hypothetical protein [Candidatus Paceibacterota bacterium]